jgi:electron transfer flavoprotein beta subunit
LNIAVCINQVPDTATRIKIAADNKSIETADVNFVINPYDEFALEEGLKLKEKFAGSTVTVFTIGTDAAQPNIRKALSMGIDKAVLIKDAAVTDALGVAQTLTAAVKEHFGSVPDVTLFGKESTDFNDAQVGPMVAELLGVAGVTVVVKFETDGTTATIEREIEGGKEIIETTLPLVITTQKGLNTPRIPSMKGIMASKSKPIETKTLSVAGTAVTHLTKLSPPPQKQAGKLASTAAELVGLLHTEAKVV